MSGSWVYGAARYGESDLDINIVLPPASRLNDTRSDEIRNFVRAYVALHRQHGYQPDAEFPGEILTEDQLVDACAGRGLGIWDGRLVIPIPDPEFWHAAEEHWYLAWLGATAFSRLVVGDPHLFAVHRATAWDTVASCLALQQRPETRWYATELMARLVGTDGAAGPFGVHPGYVHFSRLESASLAAALDRLTERGFITACGVGQYCCAPSLWEWERSLVDRLDRRQFSALPFMTMADARRFALR